MLTLHLSATYHAMENNVLIRPEGVRPAGRCFFSRPVLAAVWAGLKRFQDAAFVRFVEGWLAQNAAGTETGRFSRRDSD